MADPKILFATLGMVILDDVYFHDDTAIYDALGGSGTYSTLGARLFCSEPGSAPSSIGWAMRIGVGFPGETLDKLKSWGTTLHLIHEPSSGATRGLVRYQDATLGSKTFKYNSMPLWTLPEHFANSASLSSSAFHFFAPPSGVFRDVPKLLSLRQQDGITERPLIIWEPTPFTCTPKFLGAYLKAVSSLVDVFSPNHMELAGLFGVDLEQIEQRFDREVYEGLTKRFVDKGIGEGKKGWIVLRAGEHGCMVHGGDMDSPQWLPPYYESNSQKVVDSTGAGNSFLGGFAIGLVETGDIMEAAAYGTVAASFAIEQMGVPELTAAGGERPGELWNGEVVRGRLETYKARIRNGAS
ncbi:hypothetical protein DRE_01848 [Drechslerella stenobrocha 248]|uniref:Carbohydrate kinase PfkB domain-containing protein n=1 Tax=Drechslerella stenobrocha 248 TaxID=1043628 RepID=W7HWT4_9PEZI|nr:hypothetical protein DRE_01848 [Drechslerella stenobrocha 248]